MGACHHGMARLQSGSLSLRHYAFSKWVPVTTAWRVLKVGPCHHGMARPQSGSLSPRHCAFSKWVPVTMQLRVLKVGLCHQGMARLQSGSPSPRHGASSKWVPVTTVWRVPQVACGGTASNMDSSCEYTEHSRTADSGWSFSLRVGRFADKSAP